MGSYETPTYDIEARVLYEPDSFFREAVNVTYNYLLDTLNLASTKKELLLMQSMQGRAMNGAWDPRFQEELTENYRYPNTTIEDVIEAIGYGVSRAHKERQEIIDRIEDCLINSSLTYLRNRKSGVAAGIHHAYTLLDRQGEPLGGIKFLLGTVVDEPTNPLVGAVMSGCLDAEYWRGRTEEKFGIKMHKGVSRAVHMPTLKSYGLTLTDLASQDAENFLSLEELENRGIISRRKEEEYANGYRSGFIQLQRGYGVSDDAAFLAVALIFGIEAAFGFLLIDAVDTWDKSTAIIRKNGQDEAMGQRTPAKYERIFGRGSFPCTDDDIMNVIYLASIDKDNRDSFPSCSQRRFVQVDENTGLYPIQSHVGWVRHVKEGVRPPPTMKIAFDQIPTHKFYHAFKERYDRLTKTGELKKPYNLPNGNGNGNGH